MKAYWRYDTSQKGQAVEKIKSALPVRGCFNTDFGEDITEINQHIVYYIENEMRVSSAGFVGMFALISKIGNM